MDRRSFLKRASLLGGVAVVGGGSYIAYDRRHRLSSSDRSVIGRKRIVIAGAGSGGITVAARILRAVPEADVIIVDPSAEHHYQPGYTLVGAGIYQAEDVVFLNRDLIPDRARWIKASVTTFEPEKNHLILSNGDRLDYDFLVIALGVSMDLDAVEGLREALQTPYAANIYELGSAEKFRHLAKQFDKGDFLGVFPPGYVKCGGAPQKITWLTEDLLRKRGVRDAASVSFATPANQVFGAVPSINAVITPMMEERGIHHHFGHVLRAIDISTRQAVFEVRRADGTSRDERIHYDLLHPMAPFQTPEALRNSQLTSPTLGGQVEVDRYTLQHKRFANVFAVGDCAGTGAAKTAATIRKMAPVLANNLFDVCLGRIPSHQYDGMSGCPLLTRYGRCMMFEFDYTRELRNEWIYQSTKETRLWWHFKVHGLKALYFNVMLAGQV